MDETWVVFLRNSCTFTVDCILTHIVTDLAATHTSDLMNGDRRNRPIEEHSQSKVHKALTIQGATSEWQLKQSCSNVQKDVCAKFYVLVPCGSLGFRLEHNCVKYFQQDFSETIDDLPEKRRWFCMGLD